MPSLDCEETGGLLDLLLSPSGSSPLYNVLVPRPQASPTREDRTIQMSNYCLQHGIHQDTITQLQQAGFRSLSLLALLQSSDLNRLLPQISSTQYRLITSCLLTLDPGPPYQVAVGVQRFLKFKSQLQTDEYKPQVNTKTEGTNTACLEVAADNDMIAALKLVDNARKILECPVCYLPCPPPRIWQCHNGHLTCSTCHEQTPLCPLCRTSFSSVRPLAAERLAAHLPLPCKNQAHGCTVSLPWKDRLTHETSCRHSMGFCPILSCPEQLPVANITHHLTSKHHWSKDFIHHKLSQESPSFLSSISTTTYLHSLQDQQNWWWGPQCVSFNSNLFFLLISRKVEAPSTKGQFFFWLWIAGNKSDAAKYRYSITVGGSAGGSIEEVRYTGEPVPLEDGPETVRDEQICLLLTDGAVRRMLKSGERLHYGIEIKQVEEEQD